jgi:hypothetical protein
MSLLSLKVADNSGDERFPSIFENQPSEGQAELLTVRMRILQE